MDRREEIIDTYQTVIPESYIECISKEDAKDAMDEYMKGCCLELLEYMLKNCVAVGINNKDGSKMFLYKTQLLTKEQLFENFL